jgi:hypothetical protein
MRLAIAATHKNTFSIKQMNKLIAIVVELGFPLDRLQKSENFIVPPRILVIILQFYALRKMKAPLFRRA